MHSDSLEGNVLGGRYRLEERVGIGGMAMVYRALDTRENRVVAVKMLRDEYCNDQEFVSRFKNEIKATSGLQHPNIVEIYDLDEEDGTPYIVMEFIEGITLKDYILALQTLKWRDALNITAQLLSAVDCAHRHNVIHRDIKPQNIMITDDGQIKLADFGIARVVSAATKPAASDSAGSVHYLSPEQARGGFVDERSDLYSIGIMLYEMVTGVVPFDGESHVSIALKHIDGNIVPPHTVDPEIPRGVSDLIMMATMKNPSRRFQSAKEMYDRMRLVFENPDYSFLNAEYAEKKTIPETGFLGMTDETVRQGGQGTVTNGTEPATDPDYNVDRAAIVRSVTVMTLSYILAAVLGIVSIVFLVNRYRELRKNMAEFSDVQYQMEDYTGMQAESVVSALTEKGLQVVRVPEENDAYPLGYVIGQSPEVGELANGKTEIKIRISSLSGAFVLDDYAGSDYRDAGAKLGALGLTVKYEEISSANNRNQIVVRTSPLAGSIVVPGDAVTVYYSVGTLTETVSVPYLLGLTLDEATQKLADCGLRVGKVYPEPGSDISDLIREEPTESPVPADATATPEPATPPTVSPTEPAGEDPAEPTQTDSALLASETVVVQYPAAGTKLYKYETVDLYFCPQKYLQEEKERTLEWPEICTGESCDVRIESQVTGGKSSVATICLNETAVMQENFPLSYKVQLPYSGAPVRIKIYIDGSVYQELILNA